MPSVRASARVNLRGWEQVKREPAEGATKPTPPPTQHPLTRSALMAAPMPLIASTSDAFIRQFYGAGNTPQTRIFPTGKGGTP